MSTYKPSQRTTGQIDNAFIYHEPLPGQPERYQRISDKAKELAQLVAEEAPECPEQTLSIRSIETACFWAKSAIARHEKPSDNP